MPKRGFDFTSAARSGVRLKRSGFLPKLNALPARTTSLRNWATSSGTVSRESTPLVTGEVHTSVIRSNRTRAAHRNRAGSLGLARVRLRFCPPDCCCNRRLSVRASDAESTRCCYRLRAHPCRTLLRLALPPTRPLRHCRHSAQQYDAAHSRGGPRPADTVIPPASSARRNWREATVRDGVRTGWSVEAPSSVGRL